MNTNRLVSCVLLSATVWGGVSAAAQVPQWIAGSFERPKAGSPDNAWFEPTPNAVLRREVTLSAKPVRRAVWHVATPGLRDLFVNGTRVTSTAISPWTPFDKRVLEESFDVTAAVKAGAANEFRIELGNGWYNILPLPMWYAYDMREHLAQGTPCVRATLEIGYADGETEEIVTDGAWQAGKGRILVNSIYTGVREDARRTVGGWTGARVVDGPKGRVVPAEDFPKVTVYDRWHAKKVTRVGADKWLVDFGVNFAGAYRATVRGVKRGNTVRFRSGERVNDDGTVNVMTAVCGQIKDYGKPPLYGIAEQCEYLTSAGPQETVFEPRLTFHVIRYVQVEGLKAAPRPEDFEALAYSADLADASRFTCSDARLMELHAVARRTFRSNLQSVQSDCPGREKFGYGGDIACSAESFRNNWQMGAFYRKTVRDFLDEAADDGLLTETAPFVGIASKSVYPKASNAKFGGMVAGKGTRAAPMGWTLGVPVLLDLLLRYDGDRAIVAEAYPALVRFIRLLSARYPDDDIPECLGDWIAVEKADTKLTALAHWHEFLTKTAKFARVLNKPDEAAEWTSHAARVAERFRRLYVKSDGTVGSGKQGEQLFALHNRLVEGPLEAKAYEVLKADIRAHGSALTTGMFATQYLFEELTKRGDAALAGEVLTHKGYPGYYEMLDKGATTLWEDWDEKLCLSRESNCHPMFGSFEQWFVRGILGIVIPEDAVGCDRVKIKPNAACGLTSASGWLETPKGRISVSWELANGELKVSTSVPEGIAVEGESAKAGAWEKTFARPRGIVPTACYWYWLSGHVSPAGIERDLAAMKEAGIDIAFIGDVGAGGNEQGAVRTFSAAWTNALAAACAAARREGVTLGLFNAPGWSQSGGPWIRPQESMRRHAVASCVVKAGEKLTLPEITGVTRGDVVDLALLAYPKPAGWGEELAANGDGEFAATELFRARSLVVTFAPHPAAGEIALDVENGESWSNVLTVAVSRQNRNPNVGFDPFAPAVLTFPDVAARYFRVRTDIPGAHFTLRASPGLAAVAEKTFAKMFERPLAPWESYKWAVEPEPATGTLDPKKMRRVTAGWTPEGGEWVVFRVASVPTYVKNAAAVPEATGFEVDKMSDTAVAHHFRSYLGKLLAEIPGAKDVVKYAVLDSYEVGGQNFTDDFAARFAEHVGYDPTPYLPAFAGVAVGSRQTSDRFLWDVRRFVADEIARAYVGTLKVESNRFGLKTWLECYGHWGFAGEFLQYGGASDCVAGEFWSEGELGNVENRAAASCAHIYGKREVWSESNTCSLHPYSRGPKDLKMRTDRFFAEGVNASLLHLYVHQPDERAPGMRAWFGTEFNRHNSWFPHLCLYTDYLKRCNYLLQQGLNVADIAYFIGDDAPVMTGKAEPAPPEGYNYDFINADVLTTSVTVDGRGFLRLPHGTSYAALVLPDLETMRPETARAVERLVKAGACVIGPTKPVRSPSLTGAAAADGEIRAIAGRLWDRTQAGPHVEDGSLGSALIRRGVLPDFVVDSDDALEIAHRTAPDGEIYFVANPTNAAIDEVNVSFRVTGRLPELWLPATGERRPVRAWRHLKDRTVVTLGLAPLESVFVVFRQSAGEIRSDACETAETVERDLEGPWNVTFQSDALHRGPGEGQVFETLEDLSKSENPSIHYYSGSVVYRTRFTLDRIPPDARLSLGRICETARVRVNGRDLGGVCFAPYELPLGGALQVGENELEVEVCTLWTNRLVGDELLTESARPTWVSLPIPTVDLKLVPSGLLGPVRIMTSRR